MDSVRFGRALGFGARQAAKTLAAAADAATAPNPSARTQQTAPRAGASHVPEQKVRQTASQVSSQVRQTGKGISQGGKQFGAAVWQPMARLSGVLWLEVTGVFFGLFVLTSGGYACKLLLKMQHAPLTRAEHHDLMLALGVAVIFGYFCVSSFVRANRKQRHG